MAAVMKAEENNNHIKVFLPNKLMDCLPKCAALPKERQRWNTNEEIASYLTAFEKHEEWLSGAPRTRPVNGSIILYNRKKVKYRKDGYCWKKRKDGKTTREDHMKLKVQGMECLYGCYVHSSIIPTFHRRCYWLLQNPDIVLVHYLNVPVPEDSGKTCGPTLCSVNSDRKEWLKWSKEELICQLKPMFHCIKWTGSNGNGVTEFSVEQLVHQVLESHQVKPQPRTHACLCNNSFGTTGSSIPHKCNSTKHRIISPKVDIRLNTCSALTEVQNLSGVENKLEQDECKADGQERKLAKLPKTVLQVNASDEVSLSKSLGQGECALDPPASRTNSYCERELSSVTVATSVPNLTVATVTCSIPQNAVILMTGIGDKTVSLTPSQQLVATNSSPALPVSGHDLSLPPMAVGISLSLVPSTTAGLVLPQAVQGSMDTSETHTPTNNVVFDHNSFLNSPKQGQTYGGGGGRAGQDGNTSPSSFRTADSQFPSSDLKQEPDFQKENLESMTAGSLDFRTPHSSPDISVFPRSPGLDPATPTFPVTTEVNSVTSGPGPPAVLEKMDCSNTEDRKNFSVFSPLPPSGSPLPPTRNQFFVQNEEGSAGALVPSPTAPESVKAEPASLFPQECGDSVQEDLSPSVPMVTFQSGVPEAEVSMDTMSQTNDDTEMARVQGIVGVEQLAKSEVQYNIGGSAEETGGSLELQCNHVPDLYTIIQNDLSSAAVSSSNIDLNIDHFEISFDSQFPDLMSDFMADSSTDFPHYGSNPASAAPAEGSAQTVSAQFSDLPSPISSFPQQQLSLGTATNLAFPEVPGTPADPTATLPGGPAQSEQNLTITDFSPEWSYPEGGVKVLITGPWNDGSEQFSCTFDQITVPASLIQSGVLRCYCPAHEAGLVKLHVARENHFISNSVLFEYRARNSLALPSSQIDWLSLDDNQFRMSILERLEQMEKRMAEMTYSNSNQQQKMGPGDKMQIQASSDSFEERIIAVCEAMMSRSCWLRSEQLLHSISFRGMTLLHLAAAQGYGQLIATLIKWRRVNAESLDLEQEVDPLNVDHFSCTPLMWACALGHVEAAVTLFAWNSQALTIPDSLGRLPLQVARSRGHVRLAMRLEELQRQESQIQDRLLRARLQDSDGTGTNWQLWVRSSAETLKAPSPSSVSPDTGLSTVSSNSSPSSLSERSGPLSVSPVYFSGSVHRETPITSPELCPSAEQDVAMEIGELQRQDVTNTMSHPVKDQSPIALGSGENSGPAGNKEKPSTLWGLQDDAEPRKIRNGSTADPHFFLDYEAALMTNSTKQYSMVTGRDSMETELLHFTENVENEDFLPPVDVLQVDMITLAEQIIDATPERIKQEDFNTVGTALKEHQDSAAISDTMSWLASYLENVDQLPNFSQHRSVYSQPLTPPSNPCLSPGSSPLSDITFERVDTPANTDWSDFLNASANGKMESEFALLTLSDHEQRELYEAARIIQNAFRKYTGRRLKEQQEIAAAVIQRCYRKYKQYALYKKMTQAAILIQSKFRSYYEQKRFQQSRRAAVLIQQYYRSYKEYEKLKQGHRGSGPLQQKLKATFLTKKQDQAARKIMRFLRRCRHRMKELKQSQELDGVQKHALST
ncbi:calmodulin-binding transcription activator 2-like isoform X2 [Stegostoma tigrinum]|uniref:calmodulin-binding transcription activator 2-like isoform X2 n=1 Tax=Stegostoma tigrinum TaxID=3053191 RepID=UPI00286FD512|nr:calmodulin-binding transcription activator 2-like isoform X2 [Stegostoma tigrinum]